MGKKVGRRKARDAARIAEAEQLVLRTAAEQHISVEEAREQLVELTQIREEYVAAFEGSGMFVKDIRYDPARQQVEVVVEPITIAGQPAGWTEEARARLGVLRSQIEANLLARGRQRIAELELALVRPARTGLGRLFAQGVTGLQTSALVGPLLAHVGGNVAEPEGNRPEGAGQGPVGALRPDG